MPLALDLRTSQKQQQKQQTLQSADELSHHEDCRTSSSFDASDDATDLVRMGGAGDRPPSGVGASGQLRLFNHPSAAAAIAETANRRNCRITSWRPFVILENGS